MTGAQLQQLMSNLPDGLAYALDVDKEDRLIPSMSLAPDSLQSLLTASAEDAWASIRERMVAVWQPDYDAGTELSQARQREDNLASLDLLLSHAVWPLWHSFSASVPRAAQALADFWAAHPGGRAVLMLDSLSLRELPLLTAAARARNLTVHRVSTFGCELPPVTNTFANALGFSSRSALDNNGASSSAFPGAHTLSHALPWEECRCQCSTNTRRLCAGITGPMIACMTWMAPMADSTNSFPKW